MGSSRKRLPQLSTPEGEEVIAQALLLTLIAAGESSSPLPNQENGRERASARSRPFVVRKKWVGTQATESDSPAR